MRGDICEYTVDTIGNCYDVQQRIFLQYHFKKEIKKKNSLKQNFNKQIH